jgi:hypothetical protein
LIAIFVIEDEIEREGFIHTCLALVHLYIAIDDVPAIGSQRASLPLAQGMSAKSKN